LAWNTYLKAQLLGMNCVSEGFVGLAIFAADSMCKWELEKQRLKSRQQDSELSRIKAEEHAHIFAFSTRTHVESESCALTLFSADGGIPS
jgi:hypothetical protein